MMTYIIRRLFLMIPTLIGVTAVVFFVMALAPGGFGGTVLNEMGSQTEGEEARRIREYFNRRYGLDKPAVVQYGRWLNQVSPFGFLTSSKVEFSDEQEAEARTVLAASKALTWLNAVDRGLLITTDLAGYLQVEPVEAARQLTAAIEDPDKARVLIAEIRRISGDGELEEEIEVGDPYDVLAQSKVFDLISSEVAGRDRILLSKPLFKWPDLGQSLRGRPVTGLLREAVPVTVLMNVIAVPIIYIVAIISGIYAARHRGKLIDVGSGGVMIGLWSIPTMWVGVMLIGYLANKQYVQWFPTGGLHDIQADAMTFLPTFTDEGFQRGWLLDTCWHLVLPILCMTYGGFAVLSKLTRSSILENISSDYVRTARAKGVDESTVLYRHVFRNSLMPLITVFAAILPSLFAGSVIIESIFSIQGMGKLGIDAAFMKDREVVMGTTLIGSLLGLACYILRDILYAVADPRVSYEE